MAGSVSFKPVAIDADHKVHLAKIIFRFQVFKKPTDINIITVKTRPVAVIIIDDQW
jgi:hypothetical protein